MSKVVACIDGMGALSEAVCDTAAWASSQLQAPLSLLHVLDRREFPTEDEAPLSGTIGLGAREALLEELAELDAKRAKLAREQGRVMLAAALERAQQDGAFEPSTMQRHDDFVTSLQELQSETRLLVLGKGSHGDALGVHIEPTIRALHRPILLTDKPLVSPKRFLLAFDGSATSRKALQMVADSPLLKGAACSLVMVGPSTFDTRKELESAEQQLAEAGFEVNAELLAGEVDEVILEQLATQQADLLVMGAYGHSRIRQLLVGSTTSTLVRRSNTPLLLLR
jgi:nucleotide-binding universal stress UspA family protein